MSSAMLRPVCARPRSSDVPIRKFSARIPILLLSLLLSTPAALAGDAQFRVNDAVLADESRTDWPAYGRAYREQRFSPLTQIDAGNVAGLGVAWYLDLPDDTGLVSTPLVAEDTMYFIGAMNVVRAVDARSGKLLWEYDPKVGEYGEHIRAGWPHNRGIALWGDKVYLATWDGRLIALDRETGKERWSTLTIDRRLPLYITGAPKVFKGKVLIGNGGTELHAARGYVTAYDAETGEQAWRFWIVPGNPADGFENPAMEMAARTWTGEWWRHGGGGNAWHGFTYDAELDQLYIGTGNGSPWNRKVRSPGGGDNLFLCSIVALDPDTGEYLWHYQETPGESWDYNSNMDIVLADLEIDDRTVKALLHAPKNGFFYVIDRSNGRLVSAEPFTPVTWATHVDLETGRPVETPDARYEDGHSVVAPGAAGAHSWDAMSFNPRTGLAYFLTTHTEWRYDDTGEGIASWRAPSWEFDPGVQETPLGSSREDGITTTLQAWNPVTQEQAWEVVLAEPTNAGTLTTAGNLVFHGRGDGTLRGYDARTGKELWRYDLGLGISAPPITYAIDGRQYLSILVGWGGGHAGFGGPAVAAMGWDYGVHTRRLVTFSLDGDVALPEQPEPLVPEPITAPDFQVDAELAVRGGARFAETCLTCHGGPIGVAGGMAPDLRASSVVLDRDEFAEVVRGGISAARGMPKFSEFIDAQLLELRHYIRQLAENPL